MTRTPVTLLAALASALVVASCGAATDDTAAPAASSEAMASDEVDDDMTDDDMDDMAAMSGYVDYDTYAADPAAYGHDGPVVLFFHADWCPSCRATEESLTTDGVPEGLTVVKVDYDAMTDLRQRYGVTQQHTFVQVDAEGEEITSWTGAETGEQILAQTQDS